MKLTTPPTELKDVIDQLTERTHQLDCARHDYEAWQKRAERLERENMKLREMLGEAYGALDTQLLAAWCSNLPKRISEIIGEPA